MSFGLEFGVHLHQFLTVANVNAYVFWYGVITKESPEALIIVDPTTEYRMFPKYYYVYGQYTRHIKAGFHRIHLHRSPTICNELLYSFYIKKVDDSSSFRYAFVWVVTNLKSHPLQVELDVNAENLLFDSEHLNATETSNSKNWDPVIPTLKDPKTLTTKIDGKAVQTVTGFVDQDTGFQLYETRN
jgi:hypothetical protein